MRLGRNEVTFGLNEVTCVDCDTPMVWSDEFREWECPACGTIAYQDETCGPDEIFYDSANQDDDESDEESISVSDAAEIWESNGRDEDYTFGYSVEELEAAL